MLSMKFSTSLFRPCHFIFRKGRHKNMSRTREQQEPDRIYPNSKANLEEFFISLLVRDHKAQHSS